MKGELNSLFFFLYKKNQKSATNVVGSNRLYPIISMFLINIKGKNKDVPDYIFYVIHFWRFVT